LSGAASAAPGIRERVGRTRASAAGNREYGELFFHLMAVAVRAVRLRIVTGNDFFEGPFAVLANVFKNRHWITSTSAYFNCYAVDMNRPFFSPKSVFWRVNREVACGLAAPRAVLMQIAHPLIAAGVAEHSNFSKHRFARLYRTAMAATAITYGSRDFALRAVRTVNQKHRAVHGVLKADSGIFPAGTPYDANDPELKLWVLNTITESTLLAYELFVSKLSKQECRQYYSDSLVAAEMFGIPSAIVPQTYEDFLEYMEHMMQSGAIQVGDQARQIARALFARTPSGLMLFAGSTLGIALLPERLRDEFGFRWKIEEKRWLHRIPAICRNIRRCVPSILCANPAATASELIFQR